MKAQFYIQLVPVIGWQNKVVGVKALRLTQGKPDSLENQAKVIKLSLDVPNNAFDPLPTIEAEVEIPDLAPVLEAPTLEAEVQPAPVPTEEKWGDA